MTSTTTKNWLDLVTKADKDHYKPEVVYKWSNGKKHKSTDKTSSGIYDGS